MMSAIVHRQRKRRAGFPGRAIDAERLCETLKDLEGTRAAAAAAARKL